MNEVIIDPSTSTPNFYKRTRKSSIKMVLETHYSEMFILAEHNCVVCKYDMIFYV